MTEPQPRGDERARLLSLLIETLEEDGEDARQLKQLLGPASQRFGRGTTLGLGLALGLLTATAFAQAGVTSLNVFSANTPARASDINENFSLLQQWIEEKGGTVCNGSPCDVNVSGDATVTGTVSGSVVSGTTVTGTAVNGTNVTATSGVSGTTVTASGDLSAAGGTVNTDLDVSASSFYEGDNAAHDRLNADGFHTNGYSAGQMYIEGSAIDANTTLYLNDSRAGGQSGNRSVVIGYDLTVDNDASITADLDVGGQLTIADTDGSDNEGCMRIDSIQICWGAASTSGGGTTETFQHAFGSSGYAITATCVGLNQGNSQFANIRGRSTTSAVIACRNHSDSGCECAARYVAIGQAGSW